MIDQRPTLKRALLCLLFVGFFSTLNTVFAQDGAALFKANCTACHASTMKKDLTGPALAGVEDRWPTKELLHMWIKNTEKAVATGDPYPVKMKNWSTASMSSFESLSDKDIDAILAYIKIQASKPDPSTVKTSDGGGGAAAEDSDSAILYGVLTLILAVIALILLQVNSNLRKLADDKEGLPTSDPIPFYRNKSYITLLTLVLFVVAGFFMTKWAIGLGRTKNYQPDQPIYYSHKVHAGKNQINCLYCHGSAMEGKQANIPSVNVCMNCHMTINEYNGEKIHREDGSEVNGTAEIQKLYAAAGWDPGTKKYNGEGKAVEWIRIHNLPDHVYFNHSQHVKAGKVQCQTCHGEINNMHEVYQFAELSMGWCVNCHRESKVDFNYDGSNGNKFYSIYEKYHNEIKAKKRDSVTVNDIGGLECQKCHY